MIGGGRLRVRCYTLGENGRILGEFDPDLWIEYDVHTVWDCVSGGHFFRQYLDVISPWPSPFAAGSVWWRR